MKNFLNFLKFHYLGQNAIKRKIILMINVKKI